MQNTSNMFATGHPQRWHTATAFQLLEFIVWNHCTDCVPPIRVLQGAESEDTRDRKRS